MENHVMIAKAGDEVLPAVRVTGKIISARLRVPNDKTAGMWVAYEIEGLPELTNDGQPVVVTRSLQQALKVDDTDMVLSAEMDIASIKRALKRYVEGQVATLSVSAHEAGAWVPVTEFTTSPSAEGKEVGDKYEASKAGYHVPSEIKISFTDEVLDKLEERAIKERALASRYEF